MGDVSKGEGRTVLFVSHNMAAVKTLCNNGILLENGKLNYAGDIQTTVNKYNINTYKDKSYKYESNTHTQKSFVKSINITKQSGIEAQTIDSLDENYFLSVKINVEDSYNLNFGCTILNADNEPLISFPVFSNFNSFSLNEIKIRIPSEVLIAGEYILQGALWTNHGGELENNECYMLIKTEPRHQLELSGGSIKGKIMSSEKWI
jgi:lipopolysaccharide transport system ATP-binding protein